MTTCSVDGCEGKAVGRGWCGKHYARWRTHGDPNVTHVMPPRACSIDGCDSPHTARGWCKKHYYRWKNHGDPLVTLKQYEHPDTCMIDGCDRPYATRGWCSMHYARFNKTGDPLGLRTKARGVCKVEDCERPHAGRGYCSTHLRRWQKYGDLEPRSRGRRTQFGCSVDGCDGQAVSRHLCGKHYALWRTHGDPLVNLKDKSPFRRSLDWRSLDDVAKMQWGRTGSGYRGAQWPEHPSASPSGRLGEHTAVMSAVLGRPIRNGETVHHKNGVRYDNRPENLELWASRHKPGQRVTDLIADAHELLERYKDDLQLWPEHLRP